MQDENENENEGKTLQQKHPMEMTTDELLDYAIAPEVAERLKAMTREPEPPEPCEPESK